MPDVAVKSGLSSYISDFPEKRVHKLFRKTLVLGRFEFTKIIIITHIQIDR